MAKFISWLHFLHQISLLSFQNFFNHYQSTSFHIKVASFHIHTSFQLDVSYLAHFIISFHHKEVALILKKVVSFHLVRNSASYLQSRVSSHHLSFSVFPFQIYPAVPSFSFLLQLVGLTHQNLAPYILPMVVCDLLSEVLSLLPVELSFLLQSVF